MPIDYWWGHDIGYDHSAQARRCHGYLGSRSVDGSGNWTCSWWIPGSSERMALDLLGSRYGSRLLFLFAYPVTLLTVLQAGAITVSAFFSLRESYPPVLLERNAKKLRKETGNGNLTSKLASPLTPAALFKLSIVRPMKLLLFSPIVLALSTYMAVVYGYLYLLFTTITEVYEGQYHFSQGSVGLTYLGIGVGSLLGTVIFGIVSDRILKAKSKAGEMKPEYRLPPMIPGSFIIPIGCEFSLQYAICGPLMYVQYSCMDGQQTSKSFG